MKLVQIVMLLILLSQTSCKEAKNQYVNGRKDGDWIEYLNADWSEEVPKESCVYYRIVSYKNGFPVGLVKDYYKSGSPQSEEYLISGPYLENGIRPKDKSHGLTKRFDEKSNLISEWMYYDEKGESDIKILISTGYKEIELDKRFNKEYFLNYSKTTKLLNDLFIKYNAGDEELINRMNKSAGDENLTDDDSVNNNIDENNNYSNQANENLQLNSQNRCSYCSGSGKCKSCSKIFRVHYWNSNSHWTDRNETRPGQLMCDVCHGAGVLYGNVPINGGNPLEKKCYVSNCINGWIYCRECNYDGRGNNIGYCNKCKGSGFSN